MIECLRIKNFQSHKILDLTLAPHVNTFVGRTDVGKSSILRAIHWALLNRPTGESFIRWGQKTARVTITLEGRKVSRIRGGGKNTYRLDGKELKAFGNDVPADVALLSNISAVNFQGQYDSPFWFSETAGVVSRQLNQIINLGIIDATLGNLVSSIRKATTEKDVIQERLDQAKADREELKPFRRKGKDLNILEGLLSDLGRWATSRAVLEGLQKGIARYLGEQEHLARANVAGSSVLEIGENWEKTRKQRNSIETLVSSIRSLTKVVGRTIPNLRPLEKSGLARRDAIIKREELEQAINSVIEFEEKAWQLKKEYDKTRKQFHKAIGTTCPLCGSKIQTR